MTDHGFARDARRGRADSYEDGEAQRATALGRAVECDFCGLRYARTMVGGETCCAECAPSRTARIAARAGVMRREVQRELDRIGSETVVGEELDAFEVMQR